MTLVQCCVPSLTAENFGQVHGLVAFLLGVQPLALCFVFGFSCSLKRTGFSGFLRSGMHTLCHGKEPVRVHGVQMLLKRNPRLSGAVVAPSHHPVLLAHSQQLALLSWSAVLIHLELAFSLAYGNAEHQQFL